MWANIVERLNHFFTQMLSRSVVQAAGRVLAEHSTVRGGCLGWNMPRTARMRQPCMAGGTENAACGMRRHMYLHSKCLGMGVALRMALHFQPRLWSRVPYQIRLRKRVTASCGHRQQAVTAGWLHTRCIPRAWHSPSAVWCSRAPLAPCRCTITISAQCKDAQHTTHSKPDALQTRRNRIVGAPDLTST